MTEQPAPLRITMAASSPPLRQLISAMRWDDALARLSAHPDEARAVSAPLGETALSAACRMKAPPHLVSALLDAHPDAAASRLVGSGRTPLHVACTDLRRTPLGDVFDDDTETARLLIRARPDSPSIVDDDGWLPLHCALGGGRPGLGLAGAPPTPLLRSLIAADPSSVVRPNRGGVTPLAMLWEGSAMNREEGRCTLSADAARYHDREAEVERRRVALARSSPDFSRREVRPRQNSAAVWAKVLLFARAAYHGDVDDVGEGADGAGGAGIAFRPLHALCGIECPASCVEFAIRVHHRGDSDDGGALGTPDEEGNLPLHVACARRLGGGELESSRGDVVELLVGAYPRAARVRNRAGRVPLNLLAEVGAGWDAGSVRRLFQAAPEALGARDTVTGLYPFMLAASTGSLDVSYHLLRLNPSAAGAGCNDSSL